MEKVVKTETKPSSDSIDCSEEINKEDSLKCEACVQSDVEKLAAAFCVDCQDYLCSDCTACHCLPRPMRNHKILKQHEMPKRKVSSSLSENCTQHEGEIINFYCERHKAVGCHSCMATIHRACDKVNTLSDKIQGIRQSQFFSLPKKELLDIENLFEIQKQENEKEYQISVQCYKDALEEVKKRRENINKQFDKLEQEIKEESNKIHKEDAAKMKKMNDMCTAELKSIEKIKDDLGILEKTKQDKQLYIALKKTELQITQMKSAYLKIKAMAKVRSFKLQANSISTSLPLREDSLGQVEICKPDESFQYEQVGSHKLIEMSPLALVWTDYQRRTVILSDQNFKGSVQLKFATGPWDMTKTDKQLLAVTFPHEKKIKYLSITNTLQVVRQMITPGYCRGIAALDNKLVVTFSNPAGLKILNDSGVVKDISMNTMCKHLLGPAYVAIDEDKNIFVTDPVAQSVVKLNLEGKIENVCRSIKMPLHICVRDGFLHVTQCRSCLIHVLNVNCTWLRSYIIERDMIASASAEMSVSPGGFSNDGVLKLKLDDLRKDPEMGKVQVDKLENGQIIGNGNNTKDKGCVLS